MEIKRYIDPLNDIAFNVIARYEAISVSISRW